MTAISHDHRDDHHGDHLVDHHDPRHDPKHPAQRPVEPEHPLVVEGEVTKGDTRWMLNCLFEELMRTGLNVQQLRDMTKNPKYQALYAAYTVLGDGCVDELLAEVASRVGVHRVRVEEQICCGGDSCAKKGSES